MAGISVESGENGVMGSPIHQPHIQKMRGEELERDGEGRTW